MTPLDQAHLAMVADGSVAAQEEAARQFYRLLANAPLILLLQREAEGERIDPKVFDLPDGPVLLAFDTEERLASLGPGPHPYAVLPGRIIAQHLEGQGVSLGLNLGTSAASETLLPPEALHWLTEMLGEAPTQAQARIEAVMAPQGLPESLLRALHFTLQGAAGLADVALLAAARYEGGRLGHVLAILNAVPAAQEPLARAVAEALRFSDIEAGELDVTFLDMDSPNVAALAEVALHFEIPAVDEPLQAESPSPSAPGMDPDKPPRLR